MGTPDKPGSLTPAELYAMQSEGAAPGGEPLYDRFRKLTSQAYTGAGDALSKFQAWKDANPMAKWAMTAGAPTLLGPAGRFLRIAGEGPAPQRVTNDAPAEDAPTRDIPSSQRNPDVPTYGVGQLPDAQPKPMTMSAGMGPGDSIYKGVYGAQDDLLGDMGGLQEKRGEEYTAHLKTLATAADLQQEYANQQKAGAVAYQKAVDDAQKEQVDAETKWQTAADETAAMGTDPGRYFRNRDAGFWLNMMVGSIASGVLSAMQGRAGENQFMNYVRGIVHDDIASQEKAIDQGWRRVKGLETAYERARMRGADKVTATSKQYDLTLQALETDIKSRLAKAQLPEEKARLEGALQALQIERDQEAVKVQEYRKQVAVSRANAAAAAAMSQRAAERQARLDAVEMDLKRSQTVENYAKADKLKAESGVGGMSKEDAERTRALQAGFNSVENEIRKLSAGAPGSGTSSIPGVSSIPGTDAQKYRQGVEEWNARATVLLGPIVEAMNKGKPGAVELHDLQSRVLIPSERTPMSERIARMRYLQKLQQEAAATMNQEMQGPPAFGAGASTFKPKGP